MMNEQILLLIEAGFEKILPIFYLFISSLYFRILLEFSGQNWIRTKAHTATLLLLPIITHIITSVISGNIALSLGMVGALSIVRFRNPVRSPLELTVYFGSITLGIASSVSFSWLFIFTISITLAIIGITLINKFYFYFLKKTLFTISFTEGNSLSTLIIHSKNSIKLCEKNNFLQSKIKNSDGYIYTLATSEFKKLKQIEEHSEVQKQSNYIEIRV